MILITANLEVDQYLLMGVRKLTVLVDVKVLVGVLVDKVHLTLNKTITALILQMVIIMETITKLG